nr:type IV secretory system conjugative DNA transfer family protein [Paenibacillus gorillae]
MEKPPEAEGHVLVAGTPGTGKTTGVAILTLFRFKGGAVVVDIKGELSALTAKHRSQYDPIYLRIWPGRLPSIPRASRSELVGFLIWSDLKQGFTSFGPKFGHGCPSQF